ALVLHALVLAAQALVVLHRAEDARAEQPVTLGLERAVVDRLGLLDLAERPRADALGGGDPDLDLVEGFRLGELVGEFGQFVHFSNPLRVNSRGGCGGGAQCSWARPVIPPPPASCPRRPRRRSATTIRR